jgi:hypothetical protein
MRYDVPARRASAASIASNPTVRPAASMRPSGMAMKQSGFGIIEFPTQAQMPMIAVGVLLYHAGGGRRHRPMDRSGLGYGSTAARLDLRAANRLRQNGPCSHRRDRATRGLRAWITAPPLRITAPPGAHPELTGFLASE